MVARKIAERDAMSAQRARQTAQRGSDVVVRMRRTPAADRARGPSGMAQAAGFDAQPLRSSSPLQQVKRDPLPAADRNEQAVRERHQQRKGWFLQEAARQAANRARMAKCENFYDSEQWAQEDAQKIRDRGQNPVVYNEIKPTIDWLIGTERRMRVDFTVMAEDEDDAASDDASNKQKLLKFLDDTNRAGFERSWAAEDAFKAGIGWMEVGVRGDKSNIPVYVGCVSWRDILWDSQATRRDIADARYVFRVKVVDEDVAKALFPNKADEIDRVVQTGDNLTVFSEFLGGIGLLEGLDQFSMLNDVLDGTTRPVDLFNVRKRVLLLECWSREPVPRKPTADGLGDPVEFKVRVSIMTEHDTLVEAWSPFNHDHFPFIPVWAYKARRTGLPYSPIWPLIGPQEAMNHRMSKSLLEASANQWEIEEDAVNPEVMDLEELRAEYNAPDGMPILAKGALANNKVRRIDSGGKSAEQLQLAEADRMTVRSMSGVTGENRGERTNSVSGKAVLAKQEQGSLLTMELFDNLVHARQLEGDQTLSVAEQFLVNPLSVRLPGDGSKTQRLRINDIQPDGTVLNDITARRAHFVVGEQPWKQSYAEAAYQSMLEVLSQLAPAAPQVVLNLLDVVFDMNPNLPRKRQLMDRIRKINGQSDPDGKLSPEQQAEQAHAAQVAQMQFTAQMEGLRADVAEHQARGEDMKAAGILKRLQAIRTAAEAAVGISQLPQVAQVADELLRASGFVDQGGGDVIDNAGAPQADLMQQQVVAPAQAGVPVGATMSPAAPAGSSDGIKRSVNIQN